MSYSLNEIYKVAGISKQAVAQMQKAQLIFDQQITQLIVEADLLKAAHPGCGVEKMYYTLKPDFIGRDRFIELFMDMGYRVKKHRNYHRTTYGVASHYPNLIKGLQVSAPSVVWQSDITYIGLKGNFYYAIFIIDVYTKLIVGYRVSDHMRASANIQALKMALAKYKAPKIHHSDKGSQYNSLEYLALLEANNSAISMCKTAQENAYAERINQTIKNEYLAHWQIEDLQDLKRKVAKAVRHYNTKRAHKSLGYMSPSEFENHWSILPQENRPVITIFDDELIT